MFYLCLSLAHLLTVCHIEATSRKKGGTRADPPALQGYHHSPPPLSPLISSAFALWANAELYILVPSLTFFLSFCLPFFLPSFLSAFLPFSHSLSFRTEDHACPKCGHSEAVFFQSQSRAAEEKMKLYYVCTNPGCAHKWIMD